MYLKYQYNFVKWTTNLWVKDSYLYCNEGHCPINFFHTQIAHWLFQHLLTEYVDNISSEDVIEVDELVNKHFKFILPSRNLKEGDHVKIPTKKSIRGSIEGSILIGVAIKNNLQYLIINRIDSDGEVFVSDNPRGDNGDYFAQSDLELYPELKIL